ncbi:M48 family metallopeptidase [Halalkalicoccus jeotgali]|uniref:Peptidase M48 Ste24p n=1 Tax=Halalkalicoccus jeotgali (strain DSM 18796 / CECT 7217 / JCM 14584 / KCTC 4019 / B3) TaxID=795797 RepID=D8J4S1_HALJB|nr:M48 family metalloprotease [Halalkalicoccus jeotgali]ADJ15538.1 peptidase M48 Ste24p [Halalkalicoccus jeotgali B3]ELY36053.1 peptidase M48 Ste24p [Halalkalicoccus jeotgali B3]
MGRRTLAGLLAVAVLGGYLGAAYLLYRGLVAVLGALDPPTLLGGLLVGTLLSGYLSYRFGTRGLLRSLDARPLGRERAPRLHRQIDALSKAMDLDPPSVFVASLGAPNALAVGSSRRGAIVLDVGLLGLLSADELTGIVAHELAHLENDDGLVRSLVFASVQTLLGVALVLAAPFALALTGIGYGLALLTGRRDNPVLRLRAALGAGVGLVALVLTALARARSRRREIAADDRAADVTGDPLALARALRRIDRASQPRVGPFRLPVVREESPLERVFSTHPATDERVERLAERARHTGQCVSIE